MIYNDTVWNRGSCFLAYLLARPSMFPPSPMVMYTGADWSLTGEQSPFMMVYAMLDTRSCNVKVQMPYKRLYDQLI